VLGFAQVGPGPPLKVYTVEWTAAGGSFPGLILGVLLNRVTRIGPIVLVAALAGRLFPDWLRRHERPVIAGYAVAWTSSTPSTGADRDQRRRRLNRPDFF
jgi:hypothetical protein